MSFSLDHLCIPGSWPSPSLYPADEKSSGLSRTLLSHKPNVAAIMRTLNNPDFQDRYVMSRIRAIIRITNDRVYVTRRKLKEPCSEWQSIASPSIAASDNSSIRFSRSSNASNTTLSSFNSSHSAASSFIYVQDVPSRNNPHPGRDLVVVVETADTFELLQEPGAYLDYSYMKDKPRLFSKKGVKAIFSRK